MDLIKNNMIKNGTKTVLMLMLMFFVFSISASAVCNFQSIQYYGSCPFDGDISVFDEQGNLIMKQLYSENQGCYNGNYLMQVVGGPEQDCLLNPTEKITFKINNKDVGYDVWGVESQRVLLDLSQNPALVQNKFEKGSFAFIVGAAGVLILLYLIIKFFRRAVKK